MHTNINPCPQSPAHPEQAQTWEFTSPRFIPEMYSSLAQESRHNGTEPSSTSCYVRADAAGEMPAQSRGAAAGDETQWPQFLLSMVSPRPAVRETQARQELPLPSPQRRRMLPLAPDILGPSTPPVAVQRRESRKYSIESEFAAINSKREFASVKCVLETSSDEDEEEDEEKIIFTKKTRPKATRHAAPVPALQLRCVTNLSKDEERNANAAFASTAGV